MSVNDPYKVGHIIRLPETAEHPRRPGVAWPTYVGLGGRALHPQFALFFLAKPEADDVASRFSGATVERHVIYKAEGALHANSTVWKAVVHGEEGYTRWAEHPQTETVQQDLEERASMILPDPAMPEVPPEYGGTVLDIDENQPNRPDELFTEIFGRWQPEPGAGRP